MKLRSVILLVLACWGCVVLTSTQADTKPPLTPSVEALQSMIDSLRAAAKYSEAATVVRELLFLKKSDDRSLPYEIEDAERLVATLVYTAELPDSAQKELAEADRFASTYEQRCDAVLRASFSEPEWEDQYFELWRDMDRDLKTRRTYRGNNHIEVAESLLRQAVWWTNLKVRYAQNDTLQTVLLLPPDPEELLREAVEIYGAVLGQNHPSYAGCLQLLGFTLADRKNRRTDAVPLLRQALIINQNVFGGRSVEVASPLRQLAVLLLETGEHSQAEAVLRQAVSIQSEFLGDTAPGTLDAYALLAVVLGNVGDYENAATIARQVLEARVSLYGNQDVRVARSMNRLGVFLYGAGNSDEAENYLMKAITSAEGVVQEFELDSVGVVKSFSDMKLLMEAESEVALSLEGLGMIHLGANEPDSALACFDLAVALKRELDVDEPELASAFADCALASWYAGDSVRAERLVREALRMTEGKLDPGQPTTLPRLQNLGGILFHLQKYDEARSVLTQACDLFEVSLADRTPLLDWSVPVGSPYRILAATELELGHPSNAWTAAENDLARTLTSLLMASEKLPLSPQEASREDSLLAALTRAEEQIAAYERHFEKEPADSSQAVRQRAGNDLLAIQAELSRFRSEMGERHPTVENETFPLARVQASLDDRSAIVGWLGWRDLRSAGNLSTRWAYVIRHSGPVVWARLKHPSDGASGRGPGRGEILRDALISPVSALMGIRRDAQERWKGLMAPLAHALDGVENLIVIPSGGMSGFPVEAMIDADGSWLGDRYRVSYVPSATIHAWLSEKSGYEREQETPRVLLIGDPPFNETQAAEFQFAVETGAPPSDEAGKKTNKEMLRSAVAGNDDALASLPRLPGSRSEVQQLGALLPGSRVLLGTEATEQELVRLARSDSLRQFAAIHVATHALVDDERPERSALIVSQVGLPDPYQAAVNGTRIYDGLVTAAEITREWRLDADLVTLSACETGLGKAVGGEGYVGFAHAFLQAGARSLLVSLSKVDDRATSLLMRKFYENYFVSPRDRKDNRGRQPMGKAEALQDAKKWLREYTERDGTRPFEHPFYWSSFVLIGDAR